MLEANEEGHRKRFWAVGLSGGEFFLACLGGEVFWLVLVFLLEEEEVVEQRCKK